MVHSVLLIIDGEEGLTLAGILACKTTLARASHILSRYWFVP
jgi:hypothetical protein